MGNLKFKNAMERIAQPTPPVWMMRQAGRYHAPYQALRKEHSFIELCKKPKLAAEVAMGPMEDFDFDVAILFSDLLFPLEAMGMGLSYDPAPQLGWHIKELADIGKLRKVDQAMEHLEFQREAVQETRKVLPEDKSLVGFVGSPWTLFVYAAAGSHKGHLIEVKKLLPCFAAFCEIFMPIIKKNIQLQIDGGAEAIMFFDTAAGELAPTTFRHYIEPYLLDISQSFPGKMAYYSKGTTAAHMTGLWEKSQFAGFGYDHRWDLKSCFSKTTGFTQGNFDQTLLFLDQKPFLVEAKAYLASMGEVSKQDRAGWVSGLGHGVLPETPVENVRTFIQLVRESFND